MMEIIYQSNPESLNPMYSYNSENINLKYTKNVDGVDGDLGQIQNLEVGESAIAIQKLDGFWISSDYDPNDLSDNNLDENESDNQDVNENENAIENA
eukprot:CAMPEP_0201575210 /NCGR_PEP_ID=MMETSP0190_2-20130828/20250_1 /ASSEMBLY_ACC=CAM_ASM_000263 /TAXON_ID=37353 /ORGANISM="Rosalina sp." /LENGTH=96 /DNA_ID=CAMNT_0048004535 /DNA_START=848 /DNA_END=1138 /DNA_ORIENTATION=-